VERAAPVLVRPDRQQPVGEVLRDLTEHAQRSRAGRVVEQVVVAEEALEDGEPADRQLVDGEPAGAVRVRERGVLVALL
jgi:hypothetical protein